MLRRRRRKIQRAREFCPGKIMRNTDLTRSTVLVPSDEN